MRVELAVNHLLRRLDDDFAERRVQLPEPHIRLRRRAFDDPKRPHDRQRLFLPADLEIAQRPLRLRAPELGIIDFDGAECVGLGAGLGHGGAPLRAYAIQIETRQARIHIGG